MTEREHKFLVIRKVAGTLRDSVFSLFKERLPLFGLRDGKHYIVNKSDMTITFPPFDSIIIFKGLDDPEKIKSIAGVTSMWIEEASELEKQDFMQLNLRLRGLNDKKRYKQIIFSFNPISEEHWLKKEFFDERKENARICHSTYKHNRFIDEEYKTQLEKLKETDEQYYNVYCLGQWGVLKGQIFTDYEVISNNSVKDSDFDNIVYGLDFGFTNDPTAFIKVGIKENKKELYILDEFYVKGKTNSEIASRLKPLVGKHYIFCDSAEPKSIEELKALGINAKPAIKGKDSIIYGIQFIRQYKLMIKQKCVNFLKEVRLYKWQEDRDGNTMNKPIDKYNHLCDALRYSLSIEMKYKKKSIKILPSLY